MLVRTHACSALCVLIDTWTHTCVQPHAAAAAACEAEHIKRSVFFLNPLHFICHPSGKEIMKSLGEQGLSEICEGGF